MAAFSSGLDTTTPEFQRNRDGMLARISELREAVESVSHGGDERARQKHLDRGKLLPRDRVNRLLDPGAPFLELSQLAGWGMYDGNVPSGGLLTGVGRVTGHECVVIANDATVKGSGSHDKTGRHCLPDDPNGKLDVVKASGFWLRDGQGELTKRCRHICWDGCMFPNSVMQDPQTWNQVLAAMLDVRAAHGWRE